MKTISSAGNSTNSKISLEDKLKAKFGNKFNDAKKINSENAKAKMKVEISNKAKAKSSPEGFSGDIKDNSPDNEMTQEKLKSLIRSGGFQFNDKEREALSHILDV
jgi:hypothetical protein